MPIVGGEEIELEVPAGLVSHVLAEEHDPQPEIPLGHRQLGLIAGHAGGHREPLGARRRQLLERQPAPVADLDRVAAVAGRQQREDPPLKKGRVHATA
jgi:hypothetical protein